MKIKKLILENFKSFKKRQTINLSDTTLLFGPNSAGKSSVILALHYLQQVLETGKVDIKYLPSMGNKYIGGFKSLVNGKDDTKAMTIGIEVDIEGHQFDKHTKQLEIFAKEFGLETIDPLGKAKTMYIEICIFKLNNFIVGYEEYYISRFILALDGAEIASTSLWMAHLYGGEDNELLKIPNSVLNLKNSIATINFEHPLLQVNGENKLINCVSMLTHFPDLELSTNQIRLWGKNPSSMFEASALVNDIDIAQLLDKNDEKNIRHVKIFEAILKDILIVSHKEISKYIKESICIGPLRVIEQSKFDFIPSYDNSRIQEMPASWYDGEACWLYIQGLGFEIHRNINFFLTYPHCFDLPYKIVHKVQDINERIVDLHTAEVAISNAHPELPNSYALTKILHMNVSWLDVYINSNKQDISIECSNFFNVKENKKNNTVKFTWLTDKSKFFEINADEANYNFEEKFDGTRIVNPVRPIYISEMVKVGMIDITRDPYLNNKKYRVSNAILWDVHNNIEVSPREVGVGISQLMPIIVAAVSHTGLVSCEQPELHIHPRLQVALGDLFTQCKSINIVETHSEHLLLRILKRIRQTTENDLPDYIDPVQPQDVAINYFENTPDGVRVRHIKINEEGDFIDEWPNGFFSERREELF